MDRLSAAAHLLGAPFVVALIIIAAVAIIGDTIDARRNARSEEER